MKRRNFIQAAGMGIAGFFAGLFGVKAIEKPKYTVGVDLAKGKSVTQITIAGVDLGEAKDVIIGKLQSENRRQRLESINLDQLSFTAYYDKPTPELESLFNSDTDRTSEELEKALTKAFKQKR